MHGADDGQLVGMPGQARHVFADEDARRDLNAIIHPEVGREMLSRLAGEADSDHVVILNDDLLAIAREIVANGFEKRVHIDLFAVPNFLEQLSIEKAMGESVSPNSCVETLRRYRDDLKDLVRRHVNKKNKHQEDRPRAVLPLRERDRGANEEHRGSKNTKRKGFVNGRSGHKGDLIAWPERYC